MASRILGRYARVLCRASSQTTAAAARPPPPVAGPAGVQRSQGWPRVTERLMSEGRTVTNEDSFPFVRTQLDQFLENATVPEDVLLAWEKHGKNGNQAACALVRWSRLALSTGGNIKEPKPELLTDSRLLDMMDTASRQVRKLNTELDWHYYPVL